MGVTLYSDALFEEHRTPDGHPECSERAAAVTAGLASHASVIRRVQALSGDRADVVRIHDAGYVAAIEAAAEAGGGSIDPDTWVSPRSYEVALSAAGTLCAAVDAAVAEGAPPEDLRSFAVVRPPGHHARPAKAMGFCLFNNVAIAAARARSVHGLERVAVVDFDVHHGNGTQESFWRDPNVLFVSVHRGPGFYPGTGAADETGEADGKGKTLNLPLLARTKPAEYQEAFQRALDSVVAFKPDLILASAGFDAYVDDPVGGLNLKPEHFGWIGQRLRAAADAACGGRLVSVLEGGYDLEALGALAAEYVTGTDTPS